jgi:hypothetical protein
METMGKEMKIVRARGAFFDGEEEFRNEKTPQQPTVRRCIAEAFPIRKASRYRRVYHGSVQRMIKNAGQEGRHINGIEILLVGDCLLHYTRRWENTNASETQLASGSSEA